MAFKPTPAQSDAIYACGHILVSAAAGSGKTAVLVERVIQKITAEIDPLDIDQLLIVTFTNSAAAEMRSRIEKRLAEEIEKNKTNRRLLRQQLLLSSAKICTIDSFCIDFARQNFFELNIDPGFKVLDPKAEEIVLQNIASTILWHQYDTQDSSFNEALTIFGSSYGEKQLQDLMIRIYHFTRSLPSPIQWLQEAKSVYKQGDCSVWINDFFDKAQLLIKNTTDVVQSTLCALDPYETLQNKYGTYFLNAQKALRAVNAACEEKDWDATYSVINQFTDSIDLRGKFPDDIIKAEIDCARKAVAETIEKLQALFDADLQEETNRIIKLGPAVSKLVDLVLLLEENFAAEMKKRGQYTFAQIEHMVLNLLQSGSLDFSQQFAEVLVDEYQDVNDLQNALFFALSDQGKRLFMVGDAKQSIYSFRNANPSNFINQKESLPQYGKGLSASKIILSNNFRSRASICAYINHLFSQIMHKDSAQIEYDAEESLIPAAVYAPTDGNDVSLHFLDLKESEDDRARTEARYIADYIKQTIALPPFLRDKNGDGLRKAVPSDFAVLLRSVEGKASAFAEEFKKAGLPLTLEAGNLFATAEIMLVTSVLKAVDNPAKDISLLSAMLSPVFHFTPDRVAELRSKYKKPTIIGSVSVAVQNQEKDCVLFLKQLEDLRSLAVSLSPGEFLLSIYKRFSLIEIFSAMEEGERRKSNLLLLVSYAEQFSDSEEGGLSAFIRYLDALEASGKIKSSGIANENAVKIMSIHGSKGLQFPITILACCSAPFNKQDFIEKVILDDELYIGAKYLDPKNSLMYSSIARRAIVEKQMAKNLAEEMRLLYVAMTRAEEKLVLLISEKNLQGKIDSSLEAATLVTKTANCYTDWILPAALNHSITKKRILSNPKEKHDYVKGQADVCFVHALPQDDISAELEEQKSECDVRFLETLKERFSFIYPYQNLQGKESKTTVTRMVDKLYPDANAFQKRPAFLSKKGLTPAERGTATHKFLQYTDYSIAKNALQSELERLVEYEYLTEKEGEAIDLNALQTFFDSELFARIISAEKYEKEKSFIIQVPIADVQNEYTLVQGIADCVFYQNQRAVVVDFKTDRVSSTDELVARYKPQLSFYAKAIEEIENIPVLECVLYSLHLHKAVSFKVEDMNYD